MNTLVIWNERQTKNTADLSHVPDEHLKPVDWEHCPLDVRAVWTVTYVNGQQVLVRQPRPVEHDYELWEELIAQ